MDNQKLELSDSDFDLLRKKKNVLSVDVGTKWSNDKNTNEPAIVIYVTEKEPMATLSSEDAIPSEINGIKTDVVVLKSKNFKMKDTPQSRMNPRDKRRIAGGVPVDSN